MRDQISWFRPTPVQQVAFVEQHSRPDLQPVSPDKGKGRGTPSFQQLDLQIYRGEVETIETFDLRNPLTALITLSTRDDFRLEIQPAQPRHLYIYLVSPNGDYQALHPGTRFNPLRPVVRTQLPAYPHWFYLSGENGAYRLLLITATGAIPELDELYNQTIQESADPDFVAAQRALREYLESLFAQPSDDIEAWEAILFLQEEG